MIEVDGVYSIRLSGRAHNFVIYCFVDYAITWTVSGTCLFSFCLDH